MTILQKTKSMLKKLFCKMNIRQVSLVIFSLLMAFFLFSSNHFVLAQNPDLGLNYVENTGLERGTDIRVMIVRVIQVLLSFLGIIAIAIVMYAGWLWMTSEGDSGKIDQAKKTLINAIIGLVLILSAFSIVTFVLNQFSDLSGPSRNPSTPRTATLSGGAGALGSCTVDSVYPEPNQTRPLVPRNTSIIVSFKEDVDVGTIISAGMIIPDRVRIFRTDTGDSCFWSGGTWTNCDDSNVVDVSANATVDGRTLTFTPIEYLGSGSEVINYTVYLSDEVLNTEGESIFQNCRTGNLKWSFDVSTVIDLTSPQVKSVFPSPDDGRDTISSITSASAIGSITLSGTPQMREDATCVFDIGTKPINDPVDYYDINSTQSGTLRISVLAENEATLSNVTGTPHVPLGTADIIGDTIQFGSITISLSNPSDTFDAGDYWDFDVTSVNEPDVLTIGGTDYYFVNTVSSPGQISVVGNILENIQDAINGVSPNVAHTRVDAVSISGNTLNLEAIVAGASGNNIILQTTSDDLTLSGNRLSGGNNNQIDTVRVDKSDKKRNAVIKVNFNEAVMPATVVGAAADVVDSISVKCLDISGVACSATDPGLFACGADVCVDGEFMISNRYRTVEFVSNLPCGVNGCGETRYCLPGDSQLRVDLRAATLVDCISDADCVTRAPFNTCLGGHCQNATGQNYPSSVTPFDGIMDVARNSLDGDRDGGAEGGFSFYNENTGVGEGDSFMWSFFISNILDEEPPAISYIYPDTITPIPVGVSLDDPIQIYFNELMMSSSLRTGIVNLEVGGETVAHKALNMWSSASLGYWISSEDVDINSDEDFDITEVEIRHTDLGEYMNYNVQAGSALRDIYQNCFKNSNGVNGSSLDCSPTDTNPSCCDGNPTAGDVCP